MKRYEIPICYFPTTVLLVDDDRTFLSSLQGRLQADKFFPKFYYSGTQALSFLQNEYKSNFSAQRFLNRPEEKELDHRSIDVNVPAIREAMYNPDRFPEIAVLVLDHDMPDKTGIDLCRELKGKPFKKLILTGKVDEKIAIQAFNEGIIDKFIRKDTPGDFYKLLNDSIVELQLQYFQDMSTVVIDSLIQTEHPSYTPLEEPGFIELFNQICREHDAVEYYMVDSYGSYVFLDFEGNPGWLAVKDEDGMMGAYQFAEGAAEPFPDKMLKEMEDFEKILFLYEDGGLSEDLEECKKSLHPAKKLEGKYPTYYAFIKDPKTYDIHRDEILSYKGYLKKHKNVVT